MKSSDITIARRKVTHKRQGKFRVFHNFAKVSNALQADQEKRRNDKNALVSSYQFINDHRLQNDEEKLNSPQPHILLNSPPVKKKLD